MQSELIAWKLIHIAGRRDRLKYLIQQYQVADKAKDAAYTYLGGGFKHVLFSPPFGEMIQFE